MDKQTIAIVIPTIRDLKFLNAWGTEFRNCIGIIVEDHKKKEIKTPKNFFKQTFHFAWEEIDKELGKKSWIISRKNSGIRNFGFLKAYQLGADIIITIDDDCYPIPGSSFIQQYLENLSLYAPKDWFPAYPHRKYFYTRGIPYKVRKAYEVVVSHGLWSNILDFDAPTHLANYGLRVPETFEFIEFIPRNYFYPMSTNFAFKRKITPTMYFPLMGSDNKGKQWGYDRYDDIWAGIFSKKIIDHLNFSVVNGSPFVNHTHLSDVIANLGKEVRGIKVNENLYELVQKVDLKSTNILECYIELAEKIKFPDEEYFKLLKKAMLIWVDCFKKSK